MDTSPPRKLLSVRDIVRRWDIPVQNIYRAVRRGTLRRAEGDDVPTGIWIEETEAERWVAIRSTLQRAGQRWTAEAAP